MNRREKGDTSDDEILYRLAYDTGERSEDSEVALMRGAVPTAIARLTVTAGSRVLRLLLTRVLIGFMMPNHASGAGA